MGTDRFYRFRGEYETIAKFTEKHKTRHGDVIKIKGDGYYANKCGAFQKIDSPDYIKEIL